MDIPAVLSRIRPNAEWSMLGEDKGDYANLDWRDSVQTKPNLQELQNAEVQAMADLADAEKESEVEARIIKALAAVILDEINLLRAQHGLTPRTAAQLKAAIKGKL